MNEEEEFKMLLARAEMILTESKEVLREAQMSKNGDRAQELWDELEAQVKRSKRITDVSWVILWIIVGMVIMGLIHAVTK
jgi:hypothetical protein